MPTPARPPRLASVNVGGVRIVPWRHRSVATGIWKEPVAGRVRVQGVNLAGDDQADRRVHGGADKAVYAYAVEDYEWWSGTVGTLAPGTFGENLTTVDIDLNACHIGDRWRVGTALLEVAQPRVPCFKLGIRMADDSFPERFGAAGRPGAYLRILQAGDVGAGDTIDVEGAEPPAVPVGSLVADPVDGDVLRLAADDLRVPDGWRRVAAIALRRT